jgi:hypothetical protein
MAGPLLTFTNLSVWVFAVLFGAFTRDGLQVTGLGALILFPVFWASDFSVTTLEITQQIELWYHVELVVVLLLGALAGQELSRMLQIPRLVTFSSSMPFDFKVDEPKHDAATDWITQLFALTVVATVLGINFWAGRTFDYPSGLSPIGTDLITTGIILTIICIVLLVLCTILLIFIGDPAAALSSKYLWLAMPIPLASLIQTFAQYTWGWNNGWPEFLWYGILIIAFLITIALAMYIPPIVRGEESAVAQLIDPFYNTSAFSWIYFGILFATILVGSLLFNLIAMWRDESPSFGSYILMGYSGFVILFSVIFGSAMFSRLSKLPGYEKRYVKIKGMAGITHFDLRTLITSE